jgi:hypothetical protein
MRCGSLATRGFTLGTDSATFRFERVPRPDPGERPGGHLGVVSAERPSGYHVVTGGYFAELGAGGFVMLTAPRGTTGWSVWIDNERTAGISKARAEALCAPGRVAVVAKAFH